MRNPYVLILGVILFASPIANAQRSNQEQQQRPPEGRIDVPANQFGRNISDFRNPSVRGLLNFRGNPSRTWYGEGPLPTAPQVSWRSGTYCGSSTVGQETRQWCGTGWTGQPVVWEKPNNTTEVIFGAYDHQVHFLNAANGRDTRAPFRTGDLIKGSVTLDPDGFPFLYFGSRDNFMRVLDLSVEPVRELFALNGNAPGGIWNNDWDGNPLIIGDYMLVGGENSWFYMVKLNRTRDATTGRARIEPEVQVRIPGFTPQQLAAIGNRNVSIESSVAVYRDRVYFGNSGGIIQGYDINRLLETNDRAQSLVYECWVGGDVDATIVIDAHGKLYVAVENEVTTNATRAARQEQFGQIIKIDPYRSNNCDRRENSIEWSVNVPARRGAGDRDGGVWSTPAIYGSSIYVTTHPGEFLVINRNSGEVTYREEIAHHSWSSPVVVGQQLLIADCGGKLSAFDLANPSQPSPLWRFQLPSASCIESTPAVWKGEIFFGARDGYFYKVSNQAPVRR